MWKPSAEVESRGGGHRGFDPAPAFEAFPGPHCHTPAFQVVESCPEQTAKAREDWQLVFMVVAPRPLAPLDGAALHGGLLGLHCCLKLYMYHI